MFMDSTLSDYMNMDPDEYEEVVSPLIDAVRNVSGELIGIWHNYALADDVKKHNSLKNIYRRAAQK